MITTSNEFARQRQIVDVAVSNRAVLQSGAVEARPRQRQHVQRKIEAEAALDVVGEKFEHAPGAGAEIKQRTDRLIAERGADRLFDGGVGDVQAADAIPLGGMTAKIALRRRGARRPHGGEPFAVAGDDRIVRIEPGYQSAGDIGGAAGLAEAKEGPRAFAVALDQPGLRQQPQVPGQARLRLAQNGGQIGDGQFGFGNQHQEPQPRGFRRRLERRGQGRKGKLGRIHPFASLELRD